MNDALTFDELVKIAMIAGVDLDVWYTEKDGIKQLPEPLTTITISNAASVDIKHDNVFADYGKLFMAAAELGLLNKFTEVFCSKDVVCYTRFYLYDKIFVISMVLPIPWDVKVIPLD